MWIYSMKESSRLVDYFLKKQQPNRVQMGGKYWLAAKSRNGTSVAILNSE